MRLVKSKVKLNMPAIRKLDRAAYQAMVLTAEAVKTDLIQSQTMPFDTGSLQNENTFVKPHPLLRKVDIVSQTLYARRLYFHPEYHFSKRENPNAGGAWFEPYKPGGAKQAFPGKAFAAFYKRKSGV